MQGFLKKLIFLKLGKGGNFAVECASNDINVLMFKKMFIHLNYEVFLQKSQSF